MIIDTVRTSSAPDGRVEPETQSSAPTAGATVSEAAAPPEGAPGLAVDRLAEREPVLSTTVDVEEPAPARRGLVVPVLVCAMVPTAVLVSLWRNLTDPFWYNEQWRAYYISNGGHYLSALRSDGAPFPAGWFFLERAASSLFGSTELALRIPTALFLPLGCVLLMLLARRRMPTWAAVALALVATLVGTLLAYAVQLSEYQVDATVTVGVVLVHEIVWNLDRPGWRSVRAWSGYGAMAAACLLSSPVIFVAGPLLALDVARSVRHRRVDPRSVGALAAGLVALAHLCLFITPQNRLRTSPYWDGQFLPRHGLTAELAFIWQGLRGFVTGLFTSTPQTQPGLLLAGHWSWVLSALVAVFLCLGVVDAARASDGRILLFAMAAALTLTLISSALRYWPWGFVRTNYYMIPLVLLLVGTGAVRLAQWALHVVRQGHHLQEAPGASRWRTAGRSAAATAALAVLVGGLVLVPTFEVGTYRQLRASASEPGYGYRIGQAVASVRARARPGALVVVDGAMAIPGWRYYAQEYMGRSTRTGPPVPAGHSVFATTPGAISIARRVLRLDPHQVFVYVPEGTTGAALGADLNAVRWGRTCRQVDSQVFSGSGVLVVLACRATTWSHAGPIRAGNVDPAGSVLRSEAQP